MKRLNLVLLAACFFAGLLMATKATSNNEDSAIGQLPPEQKQGNITYLSGGVGQDEAAAMQREEPKFPLALEFVENTKPRAEYLSFVYVTIKNQAGKVVLSTVADGPFLLANLPDDTYTVIADNIGQTKEHKVVVAEGKQARVVFAW